MVEFNHVLLLYVSIFTVLCYKFCRLEQISLHKTSQILLTDMVEFNHLFSSYIGVFFIVLCYKLCRLEQFSLHKTSQILLTDMVEFNHLLFLMYQSIFHSSVLQVVQTSSLLSSLFFFFFFYLFLLPEKQHDTRCTIDLKRYSKRYKR